MARTVPRPWRRFWARSAGFVVPPIARGRRVSPPIHRRSSQENRDGTAKPRHRLRRHVGLAARPPTFSRRRGGKGPLAALRALRPRHSIESLDRPQRRRNPFAQCWSMRQETTASPSRLRWLTCSVAFGRRFGKSKRIANIRRCRRWSRHCVTPISATQAEQLVAVNRRIGFPG